MERRKFIVDGCKFCVAVGTGAGIIGFLESCSALPVYKTVTDSGKMRIPLSQFELTNVLIVKSELPHNIAVIRKNTDDYYSILMVCTHAENPVVFSGENFRCALHGSVFDKAGTVIKGPAEKPLLSLKTKKSGEEVLIEIEKN